MSNISHLTNNVSNSVSSTENHPETNIDLNVYPYSMLNQPIVDLMYPSQEYIDALCDLLQYPDNKVENIWIYEKSYRHVNNLNNLYEILKTNNKVEELKINDMQIKDLNPICEMLKVNKTIIKLDLQYNLIKDVSPLIDVVLNNDTLKTIDLRDNFVEKSDLTELEETIEKNSLYPEIIY